MPSQQANGGVYLSKGAIWLLAILLPVAGFAASQGLPLVVGNATTDLRIEQMTERASRIEASVNYNRQEHVSDLREIDRKLDSILRSLGEVKERLARLED